MGAIEGGALVRGLADQRRVRVIAADVRLAAEEAARLHQLSPAAAELCAQAILAAALLSAHIKGEERLTVQVQGQDPVLSMFAEIDAEGGVRARVSPTTAAPHAGGRLTGLMLTIKADARREMYRGLTEVRDQTLEAALDTHLRDSAQTDAVLRIETRADEHGLHAACGILIERLPAAAGEASLDPEAFAARYRSLPEGRACDLVEGLRQCKLGDVSFSPLDDREVRWQCRCSQEKVEEMLAGLGVDQLRAMADEDHGAEITCHFCNSVYRVDEERLRELLAESGGWDA